MPIHNVFADHLSVYHILETNFDRDLSYGMSYGQLFVPFDFACNKYTSGDSVAWDKIYAI